MAPPKEPKAYHIIHVDRLPSVIADGFLWCDATMAARPVAGTTIGITDIKQRRLKNELASYPGLRVGGCVPFYFCPRSVMLYLVHCANHQNLAYRGGQDPIVHLEFDMRMVVEWAAMHGRRWAFTLSNAGAVYFEDRVGLERLDEINWPAVDAKKWAGKGIDPSIKEGKQAELLVEQSVPWNLVARIGVATLATKARVTEALKASGHKPVVDVVSDWYY